MDTVALRRSLSWRILASLVTVIVGAGWVIQVPMVRAQQQTADFNTAFLTDQQLEDSTAMTEGEIRSFLERHNSYFQNEVVDIDGVSFDPASVIYQASQQYDINPQVLLATLEKESTGVTRGTRPANVTMGLLMGCGKRSTARAQLACAAQYFRNYQDQLERRGATVSGWQVGVAKKTQDGVLVTPATKAVAGQFTYTPYAGAQWGGNQPQWGGVYLFYYWWQKFGFGTGAPAPGETAVSATVLVIDISGSMSEIWRGGVKLDSAQEAALSVINMIEQESHVGEDEHQVAIVVFSSDATLLLEPTGDYERARSVVESLYATDLTNIGAGLHVANDALAATPDGVRKIVVMLSDGLTNEGLNADGILAGPVQEAAAAGTCIYTVGFGDTQDLDEALLTDIASGSGCGTYTYAAAPLELERVYIRLRHQSLGTVLNEFQGTIGQDETVDVGSVEVPSGQGEMYVTLHWPGSKLDLVLVDPWNREIATQIPGVSLSEYERLVYMIIKDPRPGRWVVRAMGVDVPEGQTDYDVVVSVRDRVGPPPDSGHLGIAVAAIAIVGVGVGGGIWLLQGQSGMGSGRAGVWVTKGAGTHGFRPLKRGSLSIGRSSSCDMVLRDPKVSGRHAAIRRQDGKYVLSDLNSHNGTYVNGKRVMRARLRGGERLRMGDVELAFTIGSRLPPESHPDTLVDSGVRAQLSLLSAGDAVFQVCQVPAQLVLGSYAGCPVDMASDALVSRRHAQLCYHEGRWYIADLGSENGTQVNGQRITSAWLDKGDVVQLGHTRMRFDK